MGLINEELVCSFPILQLVGREGNGREEEALISCSLLSLREREKIYRLASPWLSTLVMVAGRHPSCCKYELLSIFPRLPGTLGWALLAEGHSIMCLRLLRPLILFWKGQPSTALEGSFLFGGAEADKLKAHILSILQCPAKTNGLFNSWFLLAEQRGDRGGGGRGRMHDGVGWEGSLQMHSSTYLQAHAFKKCVKPCCLSRSFKVFTCDTVA